MIIVLLLTRVTGAPRRALAIASVAISFLLANGASTPALAQTVPDDRVAVGFTAGLGVPSTTFTQNVTFELYSETGSLTSAFSGSASPSFDGGGTVRLWRSVSVSVAGSYLKDAGTAQVSASLPHPLVFNQPRQISGTAPLTHSENVLHIDAAYWLQLSRQLSVTISGGVSHFRVNQDFVTDVNYSETFPYTTATFESADTVREHASATGFNVAGDAGWRVWGKLSVVGAVRYSRAHATFDALGAPIAVGGIHLGGGVRLAL
jgi:hypothetical protein